MSCRRPDAAIAGQLLWAVVALLLTLAEAGNESMVPPDVAPGGAVLIQATVGETVTLPCHMGDATDPADQMVEWSRPGLSPRFVHVRRFGGDRLAGQNPSYWGRTSVSVDAVAHGDVSLTLSQVRLSDGATYRCFVPELQTETVVQLVVRAVAEVSAVARGVLQCESAGWSPEPELLWLDAEGNLLPAGPTETVRGADGLYTVSSTVTVEKRHGSTYTCRVQQSSISQTTEARVTVAADFFPQTRSYAPTIVAAVVAVAAVVLVFVGRRWRCNKSTTGKNRSQDEEAQRSQEGTNPSKDSENTSLLGNKSSSSEKYASVDEGQGNTNVQTAHGPKNRDKAENDSDDVLQKHRPEGAAATDQPEETENRAGGTEQTEALGNETAGDTANRTEAPHPATGQEKETDKTSPGSVAGGADQAPINQRDSWESKGGGEPNRAGQDQAPGDESKRIDKRENSKNSESAETGSICGQKEEPHDQGEKDKDRGGGNEQTEALGKETTHVMDEDGHNVDEGGNITNGPKEESSVSNKAAADETQQGDDGPAGDTENRTEAPHPATGRETDEDTSPGSVEAPADENKSKNINTRDNNTHSDAAAGSVCGQKEETHDQGEKDKDRGGGNEQQSVMDDNRKQEDDKGNAANGHNETETDGLEPNHPVNNQPPGNNNKETNHEEIRVKSK